jgi:hypothetical protein
MSNKYYDIIIIGSGMAGLYSAFNIKKNFPDTTFLILEKYKKQWVGGRASNEIFYGTEIVTGAGIGRKNKDKLLLNLLKTFDFDSKEFMVSSDYSSLMNPIDLNEIIKKLKYEYQKYKGKPITFKEFAKNILGEKQYKLFLMTSGYTDYENEDVFETLYYYGLEDNAFCWKGFHVSWKLLVHKLMSFIGESHFKFSNNVVKISKTHENPCYFLIETENNLKYTCNKVIVATTIFSLKKFFPNNPIYNDIVGQPFLRLYGKFSKSSIPIMKEYVGCMTMVPGPLQKLLPINSDKGIYMIVYNDNNNTLALKEYLKNTEENRNFYCKLIEKSLGIPNGLLHLVAIKDFYWPIGTHYYKPLNIDLYKNRDEFIDKAQHPEKGILVVGEVVSHDQGWTEGALKSVKKVLSKKWIKNEC